jgi:hypothetical protein
VYFWYAFPPRSHVNALLIALHLIFWCHESMEFLSDELQPEVKYATRIEKRSVKALELLSETCLLTSYCGHVSTSAFSAFIDATQHTFLSIASVPVISGAHPAHLFCCMLEWGMQRRQKDARMTNSRHSRISDSSLKQQKARCN